MFLFTVENNWNRYIRVLPKIIEEISLYPFMYSDVKSNTSSKKSHAGTAELWRKICKKNSDIGKYKKLQFCTTNNYINLFRSIKYQRGVELFKTNLR